MRREKRYFPVNFYTAPFLSRSLLILRLAARQTGVMNYRVINCARRRREGYREDGTGAWGRKVTRIQGRFQPSRESLNYFVGSIIILDACVTVIMAISALLTSRKYFEPSHTRG